VMTLLVEDDPAVRHVVRRMLQQIGCVVQEAANGRQALEAVSSAHPDVVILDVVLPDVSGLEVLARLQPTGVPVVTMTGSLLPNAVMREKGARSVLRKPFSIRQLRHAIETATRKH
jgi:CheY-like chemotaxis protein